MAFENQGAGPFRHHEAVAVPGERLRRRLRRIVLHREGREQRKPDQGFGIDGAVGGDDSAASVSRRRIASNRVGIALAPDAQAVDSEIGDPTVPNFVAKASPTEPNRNRS